LLLIEFPKPWRGSITLAELIWTAQLPTQAWVTTGSVTLVPKLKSLLVSDGWGCAFAGIRLRRLDLKTGTELCNFRPRSSINAADHDEETKTILTNSDKKIFLLSENMEELDRWERQVPAYMHSIMRIGNTLAMKNGRINTVTLYDLDSMKVQRVKVGLGKPLLRESRDTVLACCGEDGKVWRFAKNDLRKPTLLLEGTRFIDSSLDHKTKTLWMSEGEMYADSHYSVSSPGPSYGRISVLSLKDESIVAQYKLKMKFDLLSVTNGAQFLWLTQALDAKGVSVFSTDKKLQEIERFKIPKNSRFSFMDAQLGLIFTESRSKGDNALLLGCWKI
jgi:hypothetical protein